jgi:hypothetical protein
MVINVVRPYPAFPSPVDLIYVTGDGTGNGNGDGNGDYLAGRDPRYVRVRMMIDLFQIHY